MALTQLLVQASCCECEWAEPELLATEKEQRRQNRVAEKHTKDAQHATEVRLRPQCESWFDVNPVGPAKARLRCERAVGHEGQHCSDRGPQSPAVTWTDG